MTEEGKRAETETKFAGMLAIAPDDSERKGSVTTENSSTFKVKIGLLDG